MRERKARGLVVARSTTGGSLLEVLAGALREYMSMTHEHKAHLGRHGMTGCGREGSSVCRQESCVPGRPALPSLASLYLSACPEPWFTSCQDLQQARATMTLAVNGHAQVPTGLTSGLKDASMHALFVTRQMGSEHARHIPLCGAVLSPAFTLTTSVQPWLAHSPLLDASPGRVHVGRQFEEILGNPGCRSGCTSTALPGD